MDGTDVGVRGAICDLAECTKRELLTLLAQRDNWTTPVVINAQYPRANLPESPRLRVDLAQTGFGLKLQLDLVIDDASHLLPETTASFNVLFPRLRAGGLFVIEDWSWQHYRDDAVLEKLLSDEHALEALARRLEAERVAQRRQPRTSIR